MSDFSECLSNALSEGVLNEEEYDELAAVYRRVRGEREKAGSASADNEAGLAVMAELEHAKKRQRFLNALNKKAALRLERDLARFRNGRGENDAGEFLQTIIEYSGQGSGVEKSVQNVREAILGRAMAQMEEVINSFRQGTGGRRVGKAKLPNVVKELFGEDTKDPGAKSLAKGFADVAEDLRQRANAAGMEIARLENWGLPQMHNRRAVQKYIRQHGRDGFKQHLFSRLDPERMIDRASGRPMGRGSVFAALDDVIDNILTEGWATRTPSRQGIGRGSLANQRQEHRFLVFRDADTWLDYQRDFGAGDPFNAMMAHIDGMAKDIAALEVLGPNPEATLSWLKQHAKVQAAQHSLERDSLINPRVKPQNAEDHVRGKIKRAEEMWMHYSGSVNVPVNETFADHSGNVRNVLTSSILGTAAIPSFFTDPMYSAMARYFSGERHSTWMREWVKQYASRASRRDATRMGLIMDSALNTLGQQARYAGTFEGQAWSRVLSEQMLAVTGLQSITRAGRNAFSLGLFADFADRRAKGYADLEPMVQRMLRRYDISPAEWDQIRAAKPEKGFLGVQQVEVVAGRGLAERYLSMVQTEAEYAVPSGSVRSHSLLIGDNRPGTLQGEFRRGMTMFTSFTAILPMLHGYRILQEWGANNKLGGVGYATALMLTMTVGGALSLQSKQISSGRDPREMDSPEFWGAAALQGGGLGIWGDFFFADVNRFGATMPLTAGGPPVQVLNELRQSVFGNAWDAITGKETAGDASRSAAGDLTSLIASKFPGSNTWYLKLAWDRYVEDNLIRLTDPDAEAKFRRRARYYEREYDQGWFWQPGSAAPERGPELEAALGED
ncbi:MAG: hypothetical protein WA989_06180 [Henriciella sp.]|uniref:hypothetical protein n=1 Tax=Henriciella sp. TaxID=1968823 RepID=UPI003C77E912